jgi:membrane dipeptidase
MTTRAKQSRQAAAAAADPLALHKTLVVIDALEYSRWDREILEEWRTGGVTCVHATCAIWEDARTTIDTIGAWQRRFREHSDLIMPVRKGADIRTAKVRGLTGVILGFQNSSPIENDLALVEIFHELGVRIMQLTYNNQSLIGGGCYEPKDSGLSRFGRQVVREMNWLGMLIDLSHVGERTCLDAIEASRRPVAITHANPHSFHAHVRNKSERVLKALAERGGVLGCTPYPHLTGSSLSVEGWSEMVARAIDLMGPGGVGVGSDASRKWTDADLQWIRMGQWTHETDYGAGTPSQVGWAPWPEWFETPADFPRLTAALQARGLEHGEIAAVMGGNWLRLFSDGFEPAAA